MEEVYCVVDIYFKSFHWGDEDSIAGRAQR